MREERAKILLEMPFMLSQRLLSSGKKNNKKKECRHRYLDKRVAESCRMIQLFSLTSEEEGLILGDMFMDEKF